MPPRPHFLMTDPGHYHVSYQINPWMCPDAWRADPAARKAAAWRASALLRHALERHGAVIEIIPAVEGLPDLVFPANAAVVLDGTVLLARFRHPERQGEEAIFRSAFEALRIRGLVEHVVACPDGVLQEGAGDAIWDETRRHFWLGYGQRSTANSIALIEDTFGQKTAALELASERFYHLDTCFCPLSGGKLLYYPPAFTPEALHTIETHVMPEDRIIATDDEAAAFCVNAINIGTHIVMAKAPASLKTKFTSHGFSLSEVDLSPFILSGGGAYCMTLRLDRTSQALPLQRSAQAGVS
jgi:N-dimethylarginine dimethylaminohydrolase